MALRDIANRIANTTSVWDGPHDDRDGWLTWRAYQFVNGEPEFAGFMALNQIESDERLVIIDLHDVEFVEPLPPPSSRWYESIDPDETTYDLTTARFRKGVPSPKVDNESFDPSRECRVTIYGTDRITSEGPVTRLMLHWLAHGLLE